MNSDINNEHQAILARDMISMIRKYSDNADVLEYLESFASSLLYISDFKSPIPWSNITGVCDQRYYSMKHSDSPIPLNAELLDECEKQIQPYLPKGK